MLFNTFIKSDIFSTSCSENIVITFCIWFPLSFFVLYTFKNYSEKEAVAIPRLSLCSIALNEKNKDSCLRGKENIPDSCFLRNCSIFGLSTSGGLLPEGV